MSEIPRQSSFPREAVLQKETWQKQLVILGGILYFSPAGGFAGGSLAKYFDKTPLPGLKITLIDTKSWIENTPGLSRNISVQTYCPDPEWLHIEFKDVLHSIRLVHGDVVAVKVDNSTVEVYSHCLKTSMQIRYDYLIIATGIALPGFLQIESSSLTVRKKQLGDLADRITSASSLLIVGNGLASFELACEIASSHRSTKVTLALPEPKLHPKLQASSRAALLSKLVDLGAEILPSVTVKQAVANLDSTSTVTLSNLNTPRKFDLVFDLTNPVPNTEFLESLGILNEKGYVVTNPQFQPIVQKTGAALAPNIYAIGSVVASNNRDGVRGALAQSRELFYSIWTQETSKASKPRGKKWPEYVISLGLGQGVLLTEWDGKLIENNTKAAKVHEEMLLMPVKHLRSSKIKLASLYLQRPKPGMKDGVLVTALGDVTLEVIRLLVRRNVKVRIGIPTGLSYVQKSWFPVDETARTLASVAEMVQYSFDEPESVQALFDGISRVLISGVLHEDTVKQTKMLIDAAKKETSVRFIGRWSLFSSNIEADTWVGGVHREIRQLMRDSGIKSCFFAVGMAVRGLDLQYSRKDHTFYVTEGYNPNVALSIASVETIAEVLARSLENPVALGSHDYLLVRSREPLPFPELLQILRSKEDQELEQRVLSRELWFESMLARHFSVFTITYIYEYQQMLFQQTQADIVLSDVLERLVGHPLADVRHWLMLNTQNADSLDRNLSAASDRVDDSLGIQLGSGVSMHTELARSDIELGECFARGAAGSVYRGMYKGTTVAIKVYDELGISFSLAEFMSELNLLSVMKHENIIKCYGGITKPSAGQYFLVLELVTTGSLSDFLEVMIFRPSG